MTNEFKAVNFQPFPKLTTEFIDKRISVAWKDLAWAAKNHWLSVKQLEKLASNLASDNVDLQITLALAVSDDDNSLLNRLIFDEMKKSVVDEDEIRERWMRIAVAWLYENRKMFQDPWTVIEDIWEAFDHAPALNGLIRWMSAPLDGKVGEEAMLERWKFLSVSSIA